MIETVSIKAVRAATELVANTCAARDMPLTLALHGGGEPTLDRDRADLILDIAAETAGKNGIPLHSYIATNGAVSEGTADWLAKHFDQVGISCDGTPDVQNHQRPGLDGRASADGVYRTMSMLQRRERPFSVRMTATRDTFGKQAEMVEFLADQFAPIEIRIEPVYANPACEPIPECSIADVFVESFFEAQQAGAAHNVSSPPPNAYQSAPLGTATGRSAITDLVLMVVLP